MNKLIFIVAIFLPLNAFCWGELGHRLIVEYSAPLIEKSSFENCKTSLAEILSHTNDPDKIWRHKRRDYPKEEFAHYFHLDIQNSNWKKTYKPQNLKDGFLVFRIIDWTEKAKLSLKNKNYDELHQYLYGLSHYIGDLSQPLHLNHDYDGKEAGIGGIHSQFETQMLNRFEAQLRPLVQERTKDHVVFSIWNQSDFKNIISNIASQSSSKASLLLLQSKLSLVDVSSKKKKSKHTNTQRLRFSKPILWETTGKIAAEQLSTSSKLWAYTFNSICKQ